jgi:hypothetical protein
MQGEHTVAKLIQNDGNFLSMLFSQDVVEQGRLSRAEISRDYGDGHFALRCIVQASHEVGYFFILVMDDFGISLWLDEAGYFVI